MPTEHLPNSHVSDKVEHVLAYAVLTLLIVLTSRRMIPAVLASITLGIVIELLQGQSGYRFFEYGDMIANSLGAGFGATLAYPIIRVRRVGAAPEPG